MMHKKGLLIGGIIAIVLMVGSMVLVRVHFVEAAQKLLSDMTNMGVVMEDIELHYSPLPSLRVTNLRVQSGMDTVRIPQLEIFPDIPSLLSGEIKLRHVVLQEPDVNALAHRDGGKSSSGTLEIPAIFPDKIDVVSGRLQLTNSYQAKPLTVSASVEKESSGFAFNVRSASIAELGFKFSGRLDMASTSPLKLNLQATECSIDPASFLGFLTGFGYMSNSTIPELAEAGRFETTDLDFSVDSAAGTMNIKAGGLILDSTSGKGLSLQMGQGGTFQVTLDEAQVDAGELYAMAQKSERGRNATRSLCESAKLKSIKPKGTLIFKSLALHTPPSSVANKGLSGKMTVSAKDLVLVLESLDGKKQELSISEIDADVELKDGKPVVSVRSFNVASATGGTFNAQASLTFPVDMKQVRFKAEASDFSLFDYIITCEAEKKNPLRTVFDTQFSHKEIQISASGYFNTPQNQLTGYEAQIKSLSIRIPQKDDGDNTSDVKEKFNFEALLGRDISGKAAIRRFYYNDWPFSDVAIFVHSGNERALLKASGKLFHLNLNADVVLAQDQLAAQCNVKGRGTSLPSLIACFAKDLSISLRGKIYLNANMFMQGGDADELVQSVRGEASAKIDGLQIFNLANLDPRLGFFIDLLDAVSFNPEGGEGLNFTTARMSAALSGRKLLINSFNLSGRQLQAWGGGAYSIADKHLQLEGKVRSVLGTVNSFNVDRKLKS
ncbi:AsmA-like C-terminal region-containing protein [Maridesulfovibrio sp.]|uniref:AsmA-like C-terminal region-containing protein n=1 Tax=Maridesulfovibrio sp. TaxID=2795000 RepID=UPI002A18DA90|nr:AsmA-like C-terminal region-containing protein [Maridesulfovibrio sp.]